MMKSSLQYLGYGSHIIALLPCIHWTQGPILEVGAGYYSTALISLYSHTRYCRTMESDRLWLEKVKNFFPAFCDLSQNTGHDFQHVEDYRNAIMEDHAWDIVFIDQGDYHSRAETAQRMKDLSRLVIMHDTETEGLNAAMEGYRFRYDLKSILPYTSIGSQVDDLTWLEEILKAYAD